MGAYDTNATITTITTIATKRISYGDWMRFENNTLLGTIHILHEETLKDFLIYVDTQRHWTYIIKLDRH